MSIKLPVRIKLANLPTHIEKLERLAKEWGGPEIYVKRDDLTGMALSGNKIRKLEFVIAEAKAKGADLLIPAAVFNRIMPGQQQLLPQGWE